MIAAPETRSETPAPGAMTTLILGLGNPLLTDDSVGLHVVRRLRGQIADRPGVELDEDYCGGLRLMERMIGFDRVILVDAICSGGEPGAVCVLTLRDLPTRHSGSSHDADLLTAMALGRQAGAPLPSDKNVRLVAIEAADVMTFGEECSLSVQSAIGKAAEAVLTLLAVWR